MTPYCATGPNAGKGHWWVTESPDPERVTLTSVCRYCGDSRSFPKFVYKIGAASSQQAQQRLRLEAPGSTSPKSPNEAGWPKCMNCGRQFTTADLRCECSPDALARIAEREAVAALLAREGQT